MSAIRFPSTQGELIRQARGEQSQAEFAKRLGCDRSCLSRYETERLGAPTDVINKCLGILSSQLAVATVVEMPLQKVLKKARAMVAELEKIAGDDGVTAASHSSNPTFP